MKDTARSGEASETQLLLEGSSGSGIWTKRAKEDVWMSSSSKQELNDSDANQTEWVLQFIKKEECKEKTDRSDQVTEELELDLNQLDLILKNIGGSKTEKTEKTEERKWMSSDPSPKQQKLGHPFGAKNDGLPATSKQEVEASDVNQRELVLQFIKKEECKEKTDRSDQVAKELGLDLNQLDLILKNIGGLLHHESGSGLYRDDNPSSHGSVNPDHVESPNSSDHPQETYYQKSEGENEKGKSVVVERGFAEDGSSSRRDVSSENEVIIEQFLQKLLEKDEKGKSVIVEHRVVEDGSFSRRDVYSENEVIIEQFLQKLLEEDEKGKSVVVERGFAEDGSSSRRDVSSQRSPEGSQDEDDFILVDHPSYSDANHPEDRRVQRVLQGGTVPRLGLVNENVNLLYKKLMSALSPSARRVYERISQAENYSAKKSITDAKHDEYQENMIKVKDVLEKFYPRIIQTPEEKARSIAREEKLQVLIRKLNAFNDKAAEEHYMNMQKNLNALTQQFNSFISKDTDGHSQKVLQGIKEFLDNKNNLKTIQIKYKKWESLNNSLENQNEGEVDKKENILNRKRKLEQKLNVCLNQISGYSSLNDLQSRYKDAEKQLQQSINNFDEDKSKKHFIEVKNDITLLEDQTEFNDEKKLSEYIGRLRNKIEELEGTNSDKKQNKDSAGNNKEKNKEKNKENDKENGKEQNKENSKEQNKDSVGNKDGKLDLRDLKSKLKQCKELENRYQELKAYTNLIDIVKMKDELQDYYKLLKLKRKIQNELNETKNDSKETKEKEEMRKMFLENLMNGTNNRFTDGSESPHPSTSTKAEKPAGVGVSAYLTPRNLSSAARVVSSAARMFGGFGH